MLAGSLNHLDAAASPAVPPVRVAHLLTPDGIYGAERWVAAVVPRFAPALVDPLVVLVGNRQGVSQAARYFAERRMAAIHLPVGGKLNPSAILALAGLLRRQGIEILHSHGFKSDVLAYVASRLRPVLIVSTPHGWSADEGLRIALYEHVGRLVTRRFDRVFPLSRTLERDLIGRGFDPARVRFVPNGVDDAPLASIFEERSRAQPAGPPRFTFIGRLCAPKGVFELIDAFAAARLPAASTLILAGDGPARELLAARCAALGLDGRVELLGYLDDVRPLLRRAHAVVLPSHSEGLPRVLMEACAAGVPVVATDIPGVRELITDGHSGLLVPPRDPTALARALERIAEDEGLRARLVRAARRTIESDFTAVRQAQRFAAEYRTLARPQAAGEAP